MELTRSPLAVKNPVDNPHTNKWFHLVYKQFKCQNILNV